MPTDHLAPESTNGRDGFVHPYGIEGSVEKATVQFILRDFLTDKLTDQADLLRKLADETCNMFPGLQVETEVRRQYRNMAEGLDVEPRAVEFAVDAHRKLGREAKLSIIRGGTDGSQLTERGLPTPNLSSGQHNPHSPLEWACLDQMTAAAEIVVEIAQQWGAATPKGNAS